MLHVFSLLNTQRWGCRFFALLSVLNVVLMSCVIRAQGQQACTLTLPDAQPNPSSPPYTASGGNPFDPKYWGNCTWYAWGRANEVNSEFKLPKKLGNARSWVDEINLPHDGQPAGQSLAVWDDGEFGHVAYVEAVDPTQKVVCFSEANVKTFKEANGDKGGGYDGMIKQMSIEQFENRNLSAHRKYAFRGYIHLPAAINTGVAPWDTPQNPMPAQPITSNPDQAPSIQPTVPNQPGPTAQSQPQQVPPTQPSTNNPDEGASAQQTLPEATAPAVQYKPQNPAPVQSFVEPDGNSGAQQTLPGAAALPVQDQPQSTSPAQPSVASPNGTPSGQQTIQPSGPIVGTPTATLLVNSISPTSHAVGQFTVDVYGSGFQQGAKVFAQGQGWSSDRPPVTVIDGTHLQTVIDAKSAASFTIAVRNPDGSLSGTLPMQITAAATPAANVTSSAAAPVLQSLNPTSHAVGQFTIDIYGSGFQQGAKVFAQGQGWSSDRPPVTVIDSTHLQAVIDAKNPASFSLAVRNPDGNLSRPLPMRITAASALVTNGVPTGTAPILQSVTPTTHAAGQFQVDLYGNGFQQGSRVVAQGADWNSDQASVMYLAPNHLKAIISAPNASRFTLAVRNPDGQLSGPQQFEVILVPSTTSVKPVKGNPPPGSLPQPTSNQPSVSANTINGPAGQPNTGQPSATGIASPLSKAGSQPLGSLPNSSTNAGNSRTSSTTVPNRPPGTSQSSAPVQKALPSQEPMRPIQVQTVPSSHPGSTISTTTTVVPKINVPSKTSPTTQTNPVVQQTTNTSDTQKSTNRQVKTTVSTSYPSSTAATGQNTVSKPVIQLGTPSSSTTSSTAHTSTSPAAHKPPTANSAATNQKPVPVTNTPPRGVATTTTTSTSTQQRSQPPSNQKSSSQPATNTNQNTTQKPGDKKK